MRPQKSFSRILNGQIRSPRIASLVTHPDLVDLACTAPWSDMTWLPWTPGKRQLPSAEMIFLSFPCWFLRESISLLEMCVCMFCFFFRRLKQTEETATCLVLLQQPVAGLMFEVACWRVSTLGVTAAKYNAESPTGYLLDCLGTGGTGR